jgi:superfamily II DNA/RNA helicase
LSTPAFSTLSLSPAWLDNLAQLGYVEMTPIQALALPAMLAGLAGRAYPEFRRCAHQASSSGSSPLDGP